MLAERLFVAPIHLPPTLRLLRVRETLRGIVASSRGLFLAAHWRNGRSWPCLESLLHQCPWHDSSSIRNHVYWAAFIVNPTSPGYTAIVEFPPDAFSHGGALGTGFVATRRHKKASIEIEKSTVIGGCTVKEVIPDAILRTLCKVYGLPDPMAHETDEAWSLATRLRVTAKDYSPSRTQPPID